MPTRSQEHLKRVGRPTSDGRYDPAFPVTVATPLVDQTSTNAVADTYQFAVGTFSTAAAALPLTYTAAQAGKGSLPAGMTFTPGTRTFNWTLPTGTYLINVFATNKFNQQTADDFKIVVT